MTSVATRSKYVACAILLLVALGGCERRPAPGQHARPEPVAAIPAQLTAQIPPYPEAWVAPQEPAADAALSCYVSAHDELMLNDRTAYILCSGAVSDAPAQCFQAGRTRTRLLDWQLAVLCRCAGSTAPVACIERGQKTTALLDDQLLHLCSATQTQQMRGNCVPYNYVPYGQ